MKKRMLSLILAGLLLVLPACNQSSNDKGKDSDKPDSSANTSTNTSTDPVEDTSNNLDFGFISDNLPETYDFDGAEYNIGIGRWANKAETASNVSCEELSSDVVEVALYNTSRVIEDRFKCTIQNVYSDDLGKAIEQLVATNDDYYSVCSDGALSLSSRVIEGLFYNLYKVPHMDFTQPWWTSGTEELSIGGRAYLGVSYLQYDGMSHSYILFVNKDVAERYELTLPYDDVFAGTWTTDKLYTLCSQATAELNGDGIMDENDAYGLTYMEGFTKQLQCSMGVHLIKKDEAGLPISNLDVDVAVQYISFMEKLAEFVGKVPNGTLEGNPYYFKKGNCLFMQAPLDNVYDLLETEIPYGFFPMPKMTEDQEEYEHYSPSLAWIIPTSCAGNLEFVGMISEALNAAHFNTVRPAYFETTMKGRLSDSPEDAQVLDIISRTLYADFGFEYSQTITPVWALRDLIDNKSDDAVSSNQVASKYKSVEKKLDNYITKLFLGKFNKMIAAEDKAAG